MGAGLVIGGESDPTCGGIHLSRHSVWLGGLGALFVGLLCACAAGTQSPAVEPLRNPANIANKPSPY